MNILLVEDDAHIQQLFQSALLEIKVKMNLFISGYASKALEIAKEKEIDIFIFDIQLTDYKGTELAKQLRTIEKYRFTPMIFATALAGEELTAYREIKCYHFLIKPFSKEEIIKIVDEVASYKSHIVQPSKSIRLEQKSFILELDVNKIVYVESFGKKVEIHLIATNGVEKIEEISGYSLKKLYELLHEFDFIQCHKSYLVNKRYIEKINKTIACIKLSCNQQEIPIGKKYVENVYT
ncbi:LytR/AlgR family response regulator transcription factor [Alkalihalobacterium bogoriense]|uniref:LytR/AlgR family response regulator transcription factor n=1 Tax=Alkalihalobacterium bogoriense TaxID=246272 RepID=UPI000479C83F|nr:LytTR family DNA-binding domain-containing protein [Alkalihalobacterium bogoriense]